MACYYPVTAYEIGRKENGKRHIVFSANARTELSSIIEVPCGRCIGCRLAYSKEWALRCMLESKQHRHNEFLTLTYDEDQVPISENTGLPSLNPAHLTMFMKDLRRHYEYHHNHQGIRFYACGEYGSLRQRPHFHLIVFNLPVIDKVQFRYEKSSGWIYTSQEISEIWGRGFITLGKVTFETAAYVARYILKKQLGKGAEIYKEKEIIPEFTRMSRMPGIGRDYYDQNKEAIYESDEIYVNKDGQALKLKPAKYYDKLYDLEAPEHLAAIKEARRIAAENARRNEYSNTTLRTHQYLQLKHDNKLEQIKQLKRDL